jgi:hypothetical protein
VRDAIAAILETADAARTLEDHYYRVAVQADAADALWPFDERAARSILRRAWETTIAPGALVAFRFQGEDDTDARDSLLTARRVVINVAVKHDARAAEGYMKALFQGLPDAHDESRDASVGGVAGDVPEASERPSREGGQRLMAAADLLGEGAYEPAARVVAPAINDGVSSDLLDVLVTIRAHSPREGDALYLRLLERTRLDPRATANDVLLLSGPIVSPDLRVFIGGDGSPYLAQVQHPDDAERRAFSSAAEVRRAFYATAASVLLRPRPQPAGGDAAGTDTAALYFTTGRLLPFFERESPQYAPALHARMNALSAELGAASARSLGASMDTLSLTPKNPVDPLSGMEDLARTAAAGARDGLRVRAVMIAARRELWERARTIASQVEDAQTRREALRIIAVFQVMNVGRAYDEEDEGFERASDFARAADVPPEVRAVGLAQAAELAARAGKLQRADALIDEALTFASQAEKSEARSLTALALVAESAARSGSARTWDALASLVARANETDELTNAYLVFKVTCDCPGDYPAAYTPAEAASFTGAFKAAARIDCARALKEARSFQDEAARALVVLVVARAAVEKGAGARAGK